MFAELKIEEKIIKPFLIAFSVVQQQKPFLICQQSVVRSQYPPSSFPHVCIYGGGTYLHKANADMKAVFSAVSEQLTWGRSRRLDDRRDSVLAPKSQWHLFSLISVSALLLSWNPASASGSPCSQHITSLIEARTQIKPVFIFIDDYIHNQPAVK